jgi:hypothetical protein
VLAVPHRPQVAELAAGEEQRDAGVAETEGRKPAQLRAKSEGERGPRDDRIDDGHRSQVVVGQVGVGVVRERLRERIDPLRIDREPRR